MTAGADAKLRANRTAIAVGRDHVFRPHRVGLAADDIPDVGGNAAGVLLERNKLGCIAHRRAELFGARANERLQALLRHEQSGGRTDRGDALVEVGDIGRDLPAGERLDGVDAAVRIELLLGGSPHPALQSDGAQHLEGAQMKMPGTRMDGGAVVTLDRQVRHAVPGQECRGGQPDQAPADDKDIRLDHARLSCANCRGPAALDQLSWASRRGRSVSGCHYSAAEWPGYRGGTGPAAWRNGPDTAADWAR